MSDSWGRLPLAPAHRTVQGDWRFQELPRLVEGESYLAPGCKRSYGDVCINSDGFELSTQRLNRLIQFDAEKGVLLAEAGVTLNDILQVIVPKGWFLPVVPGTRFVTLGGVIANDVHGKNHHTSGSFGCHVRSLELLRSDGSRKHCSAVENSDLFAATIGGLGLTGLITQAQVQLLAIQSDAMICENLAFGSVEEFYALSEASSQWAYTLSWVDTSSRKGKVGRGILTRARHSEDGSSLEPGPSAPRISVPITPPVSMVNKLSVDLFNRAYYAAGKRKQREYRSHLQSFFFPLDSVAHWNRMYGPKGFFQYQCVLPSTQGSAPLVELMRVLQESGQASFLAALKLFGEQQSPGLLSFPRPGVTLAVDFPYRGAKTQQLFERFDAVVSEVGGALYPAKDARMPAELFVSSYPKLDQFRQQMDPGFSSTFWRRVIG